MYKYVYIIRLIYFLKDPFQNGTESSEHLDSQIKNNIQATVHWCHGIGRAEAL